MADQSSTGVEVETVMFGQVIPGTEILAPADLVLLRVYGKEDQSLVLLPPGSAMMLAQQLSTAVAGVANAAVSNSGQKLPIIDRMQIMFGGGQ